jgi:hypothetical protein
MRTPRLSAARIFAIPALVAALTLLGLIAGLLGDGAFDAAASAGLAAPIAAIIVGRAYHRWP